MAVPGSSMTVALPFAIRANPIGIALARKFHFTGGAKVLERTWPGPRHSVLRCSVLRRRQAHPAGPFVVSDPSRPAPPCTC